MRRFVQIKGIYLKVDIERLAKLVNGRAASLKVANHLHGYFTGISRNTLRRNAVIPGKNMGAHIIHGRRMASLPGCQPMG